MDHSAQDEVSVSIRALKSLAADHRQFSTEDDSRIGSIIRATRPSLPVLNATLENPASLSVIANQINNVEQLTKQVLENSSASIGLLEVQNDIGEWVPQGTCFRVGTNGKRMATAGHLLEALMLSPNRVRKSFPLKLRNGVRKARVNFQDKPEHNAATDNRQIFNLHEQSFVWAHPRWDLLLFDLDADPAALTSRPPLILEDDPTWGEEHSNEVVVVGYPIDLDQSTLFADIFGGRLAVKRAAPGLCERPAGARPPAKAVSGVSTLARDTSTLGHDASTLPGSSGSPVFSLTSGKVVGLHYDGGKFVSDPADNSADPNDAVNLPVALLEQSLKAEMFQDTVAVHEVPVAWNPSVPRWRASASASVGLHGTLESRLPDNDSPLFKSVVADRIDTRDKIYNPTLLEARDKLLPGKEPGRVILDQQGEPACTAFALAAAINAQLIRLNRTHETVSERMLYEMARLHDEWIDDQAGGSSLRGVIKGFYQNGVCLSKTAPFHSGKRRWSLSIKAAKEARSITLGAYFRLRPMLLDFQLALNETGAILVSAKVHKGWTSKTRLRNGKIQQLKKSVGKHAFIIVGYDDNGFIIQNSWGKHWCSWDEKPGLAHWSYDDWAENLIDAWVLRLAPSTPSAFDLVPRIAATSAADKPSSSISLVNVKTHLPRPRRFSLIGHVFQVEHDRIVNQGRLGMGLDSLRETALYLGSNKGAASYPRVAFLFHDPLLGADTLSRLSAHMIDPFKRKGIYPIHIIYGLDTARTLKLRIMAEAQEAYERYGPDKDLSSYFERRATWLTRPLLKIFGEGIVYSGSPGNALWQSIASIAGEMQPACRINLFASGLGSMVAEQVLNLQGMPDISVPGEALASSFPQASTAEAWYGRFDKLFFVAPASSAEKIQAFSRGLDSTVVALSEQRESCMELPGYQGDWIDLINRSWALDLPDTDIAREHSTINKHPNVTMAKDSATLYQACTNVKVLNKCLSDFAP